MVPVRRALQSPHSETFRFSLQTAFTSFPSSCFSRKSKRGKNSSGKINFIERKLPERYSKMVSWKIRHIYSVSERPYKQYTLYKMIRVSQEIHHNCSLSERSQREVRGRLKGFLVSQKEERRKLCELRRESRGPTTVSFLRRWFALKPFHSRPSRPHLGAGSLSSENRKDFVGCIALLPFESKGRKVTCVEKKRFSLPWAQFNL